MTKSLSELPNELLIKIVKLLRNPIPPPLSHPERSAIRQPHLAVMMRVSQDFRLITKGLLYDHIITDDFPSLMAEFVTSDSFPNSLCLVKTKSLLIEYSPKGEEPTYKQLCVNGGNVWRNCGATQERRKVQKREECEAELGRLEACLVLAVKLNTAKLLRALASVAVSSRYGRESDAWALYEAYEAKHHKPGRPSRIAKVYTLFQKLLKASRIYDFCERDFSGPLSLTGIDQPCCNPFQATAHFGPEVGRLPLVPGGSTHWVYEGPPTYDWSKLLTLIGQRVLEIQSSRVYSKCTADYELTIYCSTSLYGRSSFEAEHALFDHPHIADADRTAAPAALSPRDERIRTIPLGVEVWRRLDPLAILQTKGSNTVHWFSSQQTMFCRACVFRGEESAGDDAGDDEQPAGYQALVKLHEYIASAARNL